MPKAVFTPEEDAWFDVIRSGMPTNLDKDSKADYLLRVHRAFVNRFHWRNARLNAHISCSATHVGLVLWGDEWGRMYERVRHKLNNKQSASKAKRPEGAKVELVESQEAIEASHGGQGFLEVNSSSPYASDPELKVLQEITSVRTLLYERGGYGSLSDVQRDRNRSDIPRDISNFAEVLHKNTGAEIYVIAAWPLGDGKIHYFETATENSELVFKSREESIYSIEEGRNRFLSLQRKRNALTSANSVRNAPPAVYIAFDGSERPILPLLNIPTQWKVPIIISFLTALWMAHLGSNLGSG